MADSMEIEQETSLSPVESYPQYKLDLAYFTQADRCPLMVRRGARGAFALFLYLAHQYLKNNGEPVLVDYDTLIPVCGIDSANPHARSAISRLLRALRNTFGVIDYQPVQRRRPQIRLAPARPDADMLNPRHYIYIKEGWDTERRAAFDRLGSRAFAAEYMYWIAQYESTMALRKHKRPYWFFPLEKISKMYHVSVPFAGIGLRGLVELGIMHVTHGQFRSQATNESGVANRYYFKGFDEIGRCQEQLDGLESEYDKELLSLAKTWAKQHLTNGQTYKNVEGLCKLLVAHGEEKVQQALDQIADLPTRSLKRRLGHLRALVSGEKKPPANNAPP